MLQEEPSFLCLVPVKIVIRSLDMRPIHLIGVNTETLPDIFHSQNTPIHPVHSVFSL